MIFRFTPSLFWSEHFSLKCEMVFVNYVLLLRLGLPCSNLFQNINLFIVIDHDINLLETVNVK